MSSTSSSKKPDGAVWNGSESGDLGSLVSRHGGAYWSRALAGLAIMPLGLGLAAFALLAKDVLFTILGVAIVLGGLTFIYTAIQRALSRAECFEYGIVLRNAGSERTLRWAEIESVAQDVTQHYTNFVPTGRTHVYTLTLNDGRMLKIGDGYKDAGKLGGFIEDQVSRLAYDRVVAAFQSGQPAIFGPVKCDQAGIAVGSSAVPWDEFGSIDFSHGYLLVKKRPRAGGEKPGKVEVISLPVSKVPNLNAFIAFMNALASLRRGG